MHFTLHLSQRCNMRCSYCYAPPCDGFLVLADALGQGFYGISPALNDELDEGQIIKRRHLFAFLSPNISINQVAHGRLIHLEVNVVAAGQLHFIADLFVMVHLGSQR